MTLPAGVTVALATPLTESGELDEAALDRLLQRVLSAGVIGISPLGSTGEGSRLARPVRMRMIEAVRSRIPAEIPVIAGVPVVAAQDATTDLKEAADRGATAALVAPPTYYPAADDDVERLYTAVADRSPIPIVIYNIPVFTKISVSPAVLAKIAQHPKIAGIKDSSRDLEYLQAVLYAVEGAEFDVLTGSDTMLFASLLLGAHGTIAASANLVPGLSVALYNAVQRGDLDQARTIQRDLYRIVQAARVGTAPSGWKAALEIAGVCSARLVPPADRLPEPLFAELRKKLSDLLPDDARA